MRKHKKSYNQEIINQKGLIKDNKCGIYMIFNEVNQKCYIGQSANIEKRWHDHLNALNNGNHYNTHLQNAWNKYGEENFTFSIVQECKPEELDELEILYIKQYNSNNSEFGYNHTSGGKGASDVPEATLEKRRQSFKEHIRNNPEFIENHRQKTLEQFKDPEFYSAYREYRSSEEFREKERQSHLGKKPPREAIEKAIKKLSKPVICVETGVVYASAREASRTTPGNKNINAVVCGKRKTAGGYHWKYYDDCMTA